MIRKNESSKSFFGFIPKSKFFSFKRLSQPKIVNKSNKLTENKSVLTNNLISKCKNNINNSMNNNNEIPVIKAPFLTINMRDKKVRKKIKDYNFSQQKSLNSLSKKRLDSCLEFCPSIINNFELYKKVTSSRNKMLNFGENKSVNSLLSEPGSNIISKDNFSDKKTATNSFIYLPNIKKRENNHISQKNTNNNYINFLYNKIFPNFFCERKFKVINNKLNLFYAENESQFQENIKKRNEYLRKHGKKIKNISGEDIMDIKNKVLEIKKKIGFIKGISDYSLPGISLYKIKLKNKLKYKNKNIPNLLPCEEIKKETDEIKTNKNNLMSQILKINNLKGKRKFSFKQ